jgi:hypothetical protein
MSGATRCNERKIKEKRKMDIDAIKRSQIFVSTRAHTSNASVDRCVHIALHSEDADPIVSRMSTAFS